MSFPERTTEVCGVHHIGVEALRWQEEGEELHEAEHEEPAVAAVVLRQGEPRADYDGTECSPSNRVIEALTRTCQPRQQQALGKFCTRWVGHSIFRHQSGRSFQLDYVCPICRLVVVGGRKSAAAYSIPHTLRVRCMPGGRLPAWAAA